MAEGISTLQGLWLNLKQATIRLIAPVFQEVKFLLSTREAKNLVSGILNVNIQSHGVFKKPSCFNESKWPKHTQKKI